MTTKHTPTPWETSFNLTPEHIGQAQYSVCCAGGGDIIADLIETESNAAFIVRACNAHKDLVERLEATDQYLSIMISRMTDEGKQADKVWLAKQLREQNKQALATAKGDA